MPSGGARAHSGPPKQEGSRTSERAGFSLTALDPAGYDGEVPEFPLPPGAEQSLIGHREVVIWEQHWRFPQGIAWSTRPDMWETIAEFCRIKACVEISPSANASLVDKLRQYREQIGLGPVGLKLNGWKIAEPKPAEPAVAPSADADVVDIQDWLTGGA